MLAKCFTHCWSSYSHRHLYILTEAPCTWKWKLCDFKLACYSRDMSWAWWEGPQQKDLSAGRNYTLPCPAYLCESLCFRVVDQYSRSLLLCSGIMLKGIEAIKVWDAFIHNSQCPYLSAASVHYCKNIRWHEPSIQLTNLLLTGFSWHGDSDADDRKFPNGPRWAQASII